MLLFGADEKTGYDPLISGLEPEPFETVFQELFAGVKSYFAQEEPIRVVVPAASSARAPVSPNENSTSNISVQPPRATVRSRQFPMLRCGACTETFVSEFALEHHEVKHHSELFGWYCAECNVHFDTLKLASEHSSMTHGDGEMPVYDGPSNKNRKTGVTAYMQTITKRSSDFVKNFMYTREKRTARTDAYFAYTKCELQAVLAGNVALVLYHQAKTDLLTTQNTMEHDDLVHSLKNNFIYGEHIRRVPLITHTPPVTVYRTLSFNHSYAQKQKKVGNIREFASSEPQRFGRIHDARLAYRHSPYTQNHFQAMPQNGLSGVRRCMPRVVLPNPQPIRRTIVSQIPVYDQNV